MPPPSRRVPLLQIVYRAAASLLSSLVKEHARAKEWRRIVREARRDRRSVWRSADAIRLLNESHGDQAGLIAWLMQKTKTVASQKTVDSLFTRTLTTQDIATARAGDTAGGLDCAM